MQSAGGKLFKVLVEYCGSGGYSKYFGVVQRAVQYKYQHAKVEGVKVPGRTGCLEVKVFPNPQDSGGHLVHSKLSGDGTITEKNIDDVMAKIDKIVEK